MEVRDVMTYNPEYVYANSTIAEAATKMKQFDTGFLPVISDQSEEIIGTVTDRDIVVNALADNKDIDTKVEAVMHKDAYYCYETDDVNEAAKLMKDNQVRRIIVLDKEKNLLGVLSLGDLAAHHTNDELKGETLEKISRP